MSYLDLGKRRLYGLLVALALMAVSAYSAIRWLVARALPGKWVGLSEFEAASQKLQLEAQVWGALALALPFLAALFLGLPTKAAASLTELARPRRWNIPKAYLARLLLSAIGTLGFILFLTFISFLLYKLAAWRRHAQ